MKAEFILLRPVVLRHLNITETCTILRAGDRCRHLPSAQPAGSQIVTTN